MVRLSRSREWPKASSRSIGGAPGPERRGTADDRGLPRGLRAVEDGRHQPLAAGEPAEERALADPGLGRDGVHRDAVDAERSTRRGAAASIASRLRAASARSGGGVVRRAGASMGTAVRLGPGVWNSAGHGNRSGPRSVWLGMTTDNARPASPSSSAASAPTPSTAGSPRPSAPRRPRASSSRSSRASTQLPVLQRGARRRRPPPPPPPRCASAVAGADRVLAVTPEYNGTMPAVLNNAIDWLSRPYGQGAIVGKPFAAVGATPTPYGGKWSHDDARRSAAIAGATVVDDVVVSQPALEGDILADPEVVARFVSALEALVSHQDAAAA